MQSDLKHFQQMLDDKNQQIEALNTNNKELLWKMEEHISQSRTDLHNISHKYNIPQLEKMASDLQAAQEEIRDLKVRF